MAAPPKNLHGQVLDRLGLQIVSGASSPGASLAREDLLAEQFGVSRVVIREAVKSLTAKGMVTVGPSVGTRVLPRKDWRLLDPDVLGWQVSAGIDADFIAELVELRAIIEPQAARLASVRATREELDGIAGAFAQMAEAVAGRGDYSAADLAFHDAILAASHNRFLHQLKDALSQILKLNFAITARHEGAVASGLAAHEARLRAIERREPDVAAEAVMVLIARTRHFLEEMAATR